MDYNKIMKRFFLIALILTTSLLNAFSLKDKIVNGKRGDYVVTEQAGTYTVLLIRSLTDRHLLLEEIDVPTVNHDPSKIGWKQWVDQEAPGHTAWVSYLIDLEKNQLIETYSHARNAWMFAEDPNQFLARLLTLSLQKTPSDKRKRIGPPPSAGAEDHRSLWSPPVTIEGKTVDKPTITAWSGRWPSDGSIIANCEIELYFSQFPFPYWIEVRSPHYKASMKTIDSGSGMASPKSVVFQQSPFFIGGSLWKENGFEFHFHTPPYFSQFKIFAMDTSVKEKPLIEIAHSGKTAPGEVKVEIPSKLLDNKLQRGHRYKWVVMSQEYPNVIIYSDNAFEW